MIIQMANASICVVGIAAGRCLHDAGLENAGS